MAREEKKTRAETPDVAEVLAREPDSSAEEVARLLGVSSSTAQKRLAAAVAAGLVEREADGREGRRRLPDRYTVLGAGGEKGSSGAAPGKGGAPRLRPGELDGLVLAHVAAHPEEAPFGATAVARALGRSSGAVQNCLERLAGRGEVVRAASKPRRYRAKTG